MFLFLLFNTRFFRLNKVFGMYTARKIVVNYFGEIIRMFAN